MKHGIVFTFATNAKKKRCKNSTVENYYKPIYLLFTTQVSYLKPGNQQAKQGTDRILTWILPQVPLCLARKQLHYAPAAEIS